MRTPPAASNERFVPPSVLGRTSCGTSKEEAFGPRGRLVLGGYIDSRAEHVSTRFYRRSYLTLLEM